MKKLFKVFLWIAWGTPLALAIGLAVSPRAIDTMVLHLSNVDKVPATLDSCDLVRDGIRRENTVQCVYHYVIEGKTHMSEGPVWSSNSPFQTPPELERTLVEQRANPFRQVVVTKRAAERIFDESGHHILRERAPDADLLDPRWLAVPGADGLLFALSIGLFGLCICLEPPVLILRRRKRILDLDSDHGVTNNKVQQQNHLSTLWIITSLIGMFSCVYTLSNRLPNAILQLGFSALQPVPAHLVDCTHQNHGLYKGHDQIDCSFVYKLNGQTFRGTADSLDYRFVPTEARMDAEVKRLEGRAVTALVNLVRPRFGWAYISDDWIVVYSWGVFQLTVAGALVILSVAAFMRVVTFSAQIKTQISVI